MKFSNPERFKNLRKFWKLPSKVEITVRPFSEKQMAEFSKEKKSNWRPPIRLQRRPVLPLLRPPEFPPQFPRAPSPPPPPPPASRLRRPFPAVPKNSRPQPQPAGVAAGCGRRLAPMPRAFEEISDEEWSHHNFKSSRVFKRGSQPPSKPKPPPPIDSFRYDPKASSAAGTSTATVVLSDDDDDFDIDVDRRSRATKSQRGLKRPHHGPSSRAPSSTGSFGRNPKPSKAAAAMGLSDSEGDDFNLDDDDFDLPASPSRTSRLRKGKTQRVLKRPQHSRAPAPTGSFRNNPKPSKAAATTGLSDSDEDDFDLTDEDSDSDLPASPPTTSRPRRTAGRRLVTAAIDISEEDEDLDLADDDVDYQAPRPPQQRTSGRRFMIGDDDDSDVPVADGAMDVEEDDGVNWSELENDDEDGDYNGGRSVDVEEREGDVVGMALRKCSRISADLRQELFGSSARNVESYAEIDASTCRIVTQVNNLRFFF